MKLEVKYENINGELRVTGLVDDNEYIQLSGHENRQGTVMWSTCLPVDIDKAEQVVELYKMVFDGYRYKSGTKNKLTEWISKSW